MMTRSIALFGLLAALTSGCKQETLCTELDDCGGPPPVGTWLLGPGHPSCAEDLYIPPTDVRLSPMGEVPAARTTVPEPAVFDWCLLLVTNGGEMIQSKPPRFYYESGPIGAATIDYQPIDPATGYGHYSAGITRTGTYTLDFPALCMRQFGAMDNRPAASADAPMGPMDPNGPPVNICKQLEVPLRVSGAGEGSYPNTTCVPNVPEDPGGCICAFDVTETGGSAGFYKMLDDGKTIMHVPGSYPQKATYCHTNGRLQLTGADGDYLFGTRGLRTLDLGPFVPNCTDGVQGQGELGMDCGGVCPTACPMPMPMPM